MSEMRFDERVAVITGAGRGLGRAYALLLAARGARVVVNDPGVSLQGDDDDTGPAEQVVREIMDAGGEAIANLDSVATPEGGEAIIQAALDTWGRIDILIHNAGIVRRSPLAEMTYDDFDLVLDVHLRGGFHVVRAAFPHMCKAGYGRIVLTSSVSGLYGNAGVVNYATSKTGLIGLSNVAAIEGAEHNVKCNLILPGAVTRMAEGLDTSAYPPMEPDMVAPAVGWLCHEACSVTGEMLVSMAGRIAFAYAAESRGVYLPEWTIEDVDARLDAIRDRSEPVIFEVVPSGQAQHIGYSFEMAKRGER